MHLIESSCCWKLVTYCVKLLFGILFNITRNDKLGVDGLINNFMNLLVRNCHYVLIVAHENQQRPAKISQNDRQCLSSVRATFFTHETKIIFRHFSPRQFNLGSMLLFRINKQRKQFKAGVVRNCHKFFQLCRFCS